MFDYPVFEILFRGFILGCSNFEFNVSRRFVRGFEFWSSILFFGELFSGCSNFECMLMRHHASQFVRGLAGGVNFEKSRFSVFKGPCWTNRFFFLYFPTSTDGKTVIIWLDLGIKSMLERLVLKNLTQRTSQRVKRPSGTWVMTCSRLLDRSIARSLGRSVARSLDRSIARTIARWLDRSLDRSIARSLNRQLDHSIARSLDRSIADKLFRGFEFRITDTLGNYLGGRISNYSRTPYLFRACSNYEFLFVKITTEYFYCFKE